MSRSEVPTGVLGTGSGEGTLEDFEKVWCHMCEEWKHIQIGSECETCSCSFQWPRKESTHKNRQKQNKQQKTQNPNKNGINVYKHGPVQEMAAGRSSPEISKVHSGNPEGDNEEWIVGPRCVCTSSVQSMTEGVDGFGVVVERMEGPDDGPDEVSDEVSVKDWLVVDLSSVCEMVDSGDGNDELHVKRAAEPNEPNELEHELVVGGWRLESCGNEQCVKVGVAQREACMSGVGDGAQRDASLVDREPCVHEG